MSTKEQLSNGKNLFSVGLLDPLRRPSRVNLD